MGNKEKGANNERELLHMLWQAGFACARVAGSGKILEPSCDLLAGKSKRKYAIEVKSSKAKKKYISKEQIEQFLIFSEIFGLQPIIAIKFNHKGWFFLRPEQLDRTPAGLAVSPELAKNKGKSFEEFVK